MNQKLNKLWLALEKEKDLFEGEVKNATTLQQQWKPSLESWNMLQVLAHLVAVEKVGFDYLLSKNYTNAKPAKGVRHIFNSFLLSAGLLSPIRFKVPDGANLSPPQDLEAHLSFEQWVRGREKIFFYLKNFPEEKLHFLIFRHPLAGWLSIAQTLKFMKEHIHHHRLQLRRIRNAKGFPA